MAGHAVPDARSPDVAAVVLAAGVGSRMGASVNKVFLLVGGIPILARALEPFESNPQIAEVVLVAAADELAECRHRVLEPFGFKKVREVVIGGATRHESEFNGLRALEPRIESGAITIALVHDAVRPFATAAQIDALIAETRRSGASILAIPAAGNLAVRDADGCAGEPEPGLWEAQTPQAFDARLILAAHRAAFAEGFQGTDTSSVLERTGRGVSVVEGGETNIKITTSDDLLLAARIAGEGRRGATSPSARGGA
ncbi:MAG: 2-C-methyl-D-erythritol 4-phosphate cytidylyltransferase [Candidatus Dormibacteraceae bacterium]